MVFIFQIVFPVLKVTKMIMGQFMGDESHRDVFIKFIQLPRIYPDLVIACDFRNAPENCRPFNH